LMKNAQNSSKFAIKLTRKLRPIFEMENQTNAPTLLTLNQPFEEDDKPVAEFKIIMLGDGGVGKRTLARKFVIDEGKKRYIATLGVEVHEIMFYTNHGPIRLNIWTNCGAERLGGYRDGYYIGAHAAIIMFDVTSRITYKNVPKWYRDVTRCCENIPIVLVGNKVDSQNRKVKDRQITFHKKKSLEYVDVSIKGNYHVEELFLWMLRRLVANEKLYLMKPLVLKPAEIEIDSQYIEFMEQEKKEAEKILLDWDDEDYEFW